MHDAEHARTTLGCTHDLATATSMMARSVDVCSPPPRSQNTTTLTATSRFRQRPEGWRPGAACTEAWGPAEQARAHVCVSACACVCECVSA